MTCSLDTGTDQLLQSVGRLRKLQIEQKVFLFITDELSLQMQNQKKKKKIDILLGYCDQFKKKLSWKKNEIAFNSKSIV